MAAAGMGTFAFFENAAKVASVAMAAAGLDSQGWTWFGLASEGGSRRNELVIRNGLDITIEQHGFYIDWGKTKIPLEGELPAKIIDRALFHKAGSWTATGTSGLITFKLGHGTYLHYIWDCPFDFNFSDNYVGLMLTSDPNLINCDRKALFKNMNMSRNWRTLNLGLPRKDSYYDLVCCGPSNGGSHETGGKQPWGFGRPCKVSNEHYTVYATMGDRHATTCKVTIRPKFPNDSNQNIDESQESNTNTGQDQMQTCTESFGSIHKSESLVPLIQSVELAQEA